MNYLKMIFMLLVFLTATKSNNGGTVASTLSFDVIELELLPVKVKPNPVAVWEYNKLRKEVKTILNDVKYYYGVDSTHLVYMDSVRKNFRIPKDIFYRQIYKESMYIFDIESPVGARGYMQIMYGTYEFFKDELSLTDPTRTDPFENVLTGSYYMRYLKDKMDVRYGRIPEKTKWKYALAAYHSGLGGYKRDLKTGPNCKGYVKFILKNRS